MGLEWIVVALFVVVFVGGIGALIARDRRATAARVAGIEALGWRYEKTGAGFCVVGGDAIPWTLTLQKSTGSSGSSGTRSTTTMWQTAAEPTDAVVLLGPKLPDFIAKMNLGGSLVQFALRKILGDEATDLVDVREMHLGSTVFRERFTVMSSSEPMAESILTESIEEALLSSPLTDAAVLRWRDRLEVRVSHGTWDIDEIRSLVSLGTTVAQRCGYGPDT